MQDIGIAVKRLQWRHHTEASKQLAELGVSLPQWDVLRRLYENPSASLHALAQLTFQTDQSFGSLATRMVDRGLIERVPGPGRAVKHRLTAEGQRLRAAGQELVDEVFGQSFGGLTDHQLDQLGDLLDSALGADSPWRDIRGATVATIHKGRTRHDATAP